MKSVSLNTKFFDTIRPLFGKLSQDQVQGVTDLVQEGWRRGLSNAEVAYVLATVFHETAKWMQPIREGAIRYGTEYTDAQAKAAVTAIYNKGIIKTNYSLPAGPFKQSYYGRGYVQITWYDNYQKYADILGIDLARDPDLALVPEYAMAILYDGIINGRFRSKKLSDYKLPEQFSAARDIVNGDSRTVGPEINRVATVFLSALNQTPRQSAPEARPVPKPVPSVPSEAPKKDAAVEAPVAALAFLVVLVVLYLIYLT